MENVGQAKTITRLPGNLFPLLSGVPHRERGTGAACTDSNLGGQSSRKAFQFVLNGLQIRIAGEIAEAVSHDLLRVGVISN